MTRNSLIYLFILFISLTACRETYWPELTKYEDRLVIDGTITDEPGPYEVRLTVSSKAQEAELNFYPGAQVTILDDQGIEEVLTEISPGIHQTDPNGIQGVVGRKYSIVIRTPDEKTYESSFQELHKPVGLDTVYAVIESRTTEDPDYQLWGYQFYLSTKMAESDTNYYLWRTHATFEYHSDFLIRYIYDGRANLFPDADSLYYCWSRDNINTNMTASTVNFSEPVIRDLPLNFVSTETRKLSVKYSLLVEQYTLAEEAHQFYKAVQGISSEQGTLYSTLPYQVRGNVKNVLDPEEPVLGFFLAAGVDKKRVFFDSPTGDFNFSYSTCILTRSDYEAYGYIGWTDPVSWPLYVTTNPDGVRALPPQGCMDCRERGGTIEKPDFWID